MHTSNLILAAALLLLGVGCFEQVTVGAAGAPLDPECPSALLEYAAACESCSSAPPMTPADADGVCGDPQEPWVSCIPEVRSVVACREASSAGDCDGWVSACQPVLEALGACLGGQP